MLLQYRDTLTNQCQKFCKSIRSSITLQDDEKLMNEWLVVLNQTELALGRELQHLPGDISHMEIFRVIDTLSTSTIETADVNSNKERAKMMKRFFRDQHVVTTLALLPTNELEFFFQPDNKLQTHLFARLRENVKHFMEQGGRQPHPATEQQKMCSELGLAGSKALKLMWKWSPLIATTASLHSLRTTPVMM